MVREHHVREHGRRTKRSTSRVREHMRGEPDARERLARPTTRTPSWVRHDLYPPYYEERLAMDNGEYVVRDSESFSGGFELYFTPRHMQRDAEPILLGDFATRLEAKSEAIHHSTQEAS